MGLRGKAGHEAVTKLLEAVFKLLRAAGRPIGAIASRDGLVTGKGNVEDIILVVTRVTVEAIVGEAEFCEGQRRLAG